MSEGTFLRDTIVIQNGSFGVGLTSLPSFKLQVDNPSGSTYGASFRNTNDNLQLKIGTISGGVLNIQGAVISSGATYNFGLQADGGNVGVGTANPSGGKLHITNGVGNGSGVCLYVDGSGDIRCNTGGSLFFGAYDYGGSTYIRGWDSSSGLYFYIDGTLRTQISNGTYALDVVGDGRFSGRGWFPSGAVVSETGNGGFEYRTNSSWGGWARNAFTIADGSGTDLVSYGGYGGSGTTLSYGYLGKSYTDYCIAFQPDGITYITYDGSTKFNTESWGVKVTGNLGVGVTASAALHVSGNGIFQGSSGDGVVKIYGSSSAYDGVIELLNESGASTEGFRIRYDNNVGDTYFDNIWSSGSDVNPAIRFRTKTYSATVDAMTITHGGNVGIGTTSPTFKLDVSGDARINDSGAANGTASQTMQVVNTTAGATSSYMYIGASSGTDWKVGKNVLGTLSRTNFDITTHVDTFGLTINTSGCVGIGTSSPSYKLDVAGEINTSSTYKLSGNNVVAKRQFVVSLPTGSGYSSSYFYPVHVYMNYTAIGSIDNTYVSVRMPSQSGGASYNAHNMYGWIVGGGWTDSPSYCGVYHTFYDTNERSILGVYRSTQNSYGPVVYLRGGQTYYITTTADTVNFSTSALTAGNSTFAVKNADGSDYSGTSANISLLFDTYNSDAGRLEPSNLYVAGNMSVGTTSTIGKLYVKSYQANGTYYRADSANGRVAYIDDVGNTGRLGIGYAGYTQISFGGGANNYINNGFNLGIGTASPLQKVHVDGSILLDGVTNGYAQGATRGIGYGSNSGGVSVDGFSGMDIQSVNAPSPYSGNYSQNLRFFTHHWGAQTGGTPRMFIQYDGKVGIGTTTPTVKLSVNGELSCGDGMKLTFIGLDINSQSTPSFIKIRTKIPFASGSADFTVNIKGFQYGSAQMTSLTVGWHYYNSTFYSAALSSSGAYAPVVKLSAEDWDSSGTKKVCIVLVAPGYWPKLYVESMYSSAYSDAYADGWTWDTNDATATGSELVTPAYKSNFGNNFVMLGSGSVGIGTASPSQKLHVNGNVTATAYYGDGSNLTGISTSSSSNTQSQKSGTTTLTLNVGSYALHVVPLASGTTISSITYSSAPSSGTVSSIIVILKYSGTATVTWTNVIWSGGVTPTLTGSSGKGDVFSLTSYNGGSNWIGAVIAQNLDSTNL